MHLTRSYKDTDFKFEMSANMDSNTSKGEMVSGEADGDLDAQACECSCLELGVKKFSDCTLANPL